MRLPKQRYGEDNAKEEAPMSTPHFMVQYESVLIYRGGCDHEQEH